MRAWRGCCNGERRQQQERPVTTMSRRATSAVLGDAVCHDGDLDIYLFPLFSSLFATYRSSIFLGLLLDQSIRRSRSRHQGLCPDANPSPSDLLATGDGPLIKSLYQCTSSLFMVALATTLHLTHKSRRLCVCKP